MLVVLPVVSATAQVTVVYQGQPVDLSIEPQPPGSTYKWEIYCDMTVDFAKIPGNCASGEYDFADGIDDEAAVQVVFNTPGEYMVKIEVWDAVACTNNMKFLRIDVEESLPTVELVGDSVCVGDPAILTLEFTGEGPWSGTYTDGTDSWTFNSDESTLEIPIMTTAEGTTQYWVTELTDANGTNYSVDTPSGKVRVVVYPKPNISRIYLKE
jgi:hypothetical protein